MHPILSSNNKDGYFVKTVTLHVPNHRPCDPYIYRDAESADVFAPTCDERYFGTI